MVTRGDLRSPRVVAMNSYTAHSVRTEIHCHILPGVDDGARDFDDSIEMAALAAADGTRTLVVTSHVRPDFVTDVSMLPSLAAELRAERGRR